MRFSPKNLLNHRSKIFFQKLSELGISDIKIAQTLSEGNEHKEPLKDISIEDLLSRPAKDLNKDVIANFIAGKVVLVTGGGGALGARLRGNVSFLGQKSSFCLTIANTICMLFARKSQQRFL